jgi:hypothetical protein
MPNSQTQDDASSHEMKKFVNVEQLFTFREVLAARSANQHTMWYGDGVDPNTAAMRLKSGEYIKVGVSPKFQIKRSSRVFTIGSCFARNIERALLSQNIDVVTGKFSLPPEAYMAKANPGGALNKYNTHSIESEILSAFDLVNYPNSGLIEADDGLWWDPLSTMTKIADFETVSGVREKIRAVTQRLVDCDAVVITLGLNEVWVDRETGIYMNQMPPAPLMRKHKDRFAISLSGYEDNMATLERTISVIRSKAKDNLKIVFTVSPVPMGATLTPRDVIVANTYSKSMLRICSQALSNKYDFVDYFPSYEMVMNSPRDITWHDDLIHVRDEAVRFITSYFIEKYVEP